MARSHGEPVVGPRLGAHAPADAGGAGPPGPRGVAAAVADAGGAGRRARGRGRPGLGPARLPAPGPAPARGSDRDRRAARRRGAVVVRRPAGAARGRRLHRSGRRHVRVRAAARRARHQRAAGAGPGAGGRGAAGTVGHPRRARPGRRGAARGRGHGCDVVDRADGARRAGVHGAVAEVWRVPGLGPVRVARRRLPGVRRPGARRTQAWAGTDRQCRGRLLAVLRDDDGPGAPLRSRPRSGPTTPSANAAWTGSSGTAWSSRWDRRPTRSPDPDRPRRRDPHLRAGP